jgi:hypothetical protein
MGHSNPAHTSIYRIIQYNTYINPVLASTRHNSMYRIHTNNTYIQIRTPQVLSYPASTFIPRTYPGTGTFNTVPQTVSRWYRYIQYRTKQTLPRRYIHSKVPTIRTVRIPYPYSKLTTRTKHTCTRACMHTNPYSYRIPQEPPPFSGKITRFVIHSPVDSQTIIRSHF